MRKALIAVIVASALFAVGAFAAQVAINSDDVASGEDAVESCASSANVIEYTTGSTVNGTTGTADWQATGATIQLIEATGKNCEGAAVDIAIGSDTSATPDTTADTWTDGTCTATGNPLVYACTFAATTVRPIVEVAVLVNGNSVNATA